MSYAPVLIGLAAACTPSSPRLAWTIDFASGAPRPPVVVAVRAWIQPGGCDGGEPIYAVVLTPSGAMVAEPPHLDDGTWGFGADALDAQCRTVARACEDVVVPSMSGAVTLLLDAVDPPSGGCAAPTVCEEGVCVGVIDAGVDDAGMRDAGMRDAGMGDAGMRDAGMRDAGRDAGRDACPTSETVCGDSLDGDCDGLIDCDDPDCMGVTCAAGARCGDGVCCSTCVTEAGNCVAGTTWANCGTGGGACSRCPDCVACNGGVCSGSPAAGNPCAAGTCMGTTTLTCCTGCITGSVTTGTCQPGTTPSLCGNGGDSCATCGAGTICTSQGTCCGGCVVSTGGCRSGTSETQCGTGGEACFSCGAGVTCCNAPSGMGGVCLSGSCP